MGLGPRRPDAGRLQHRSAALFFCRDFANGFLIAEILSRYYPADVQMHSFEAVASSTRKKQNWHLLEKLFKVKRAHTTQGRS